MKDQARREGRLVWYAGPNPMTKILVVLFHAKYPEIQVRTVPLDGPVMGERFLCEKEAGFEAADVMSGGASQCFPLFRERGWLADLRGLPNWRSHPAWAKDPLGASFAYLNMKTVLMYNTWMVAD